MKGTKRKGREGVWELRVYVGRDPGTGTPRQISKTFYGGSRGADDALRDMIQDQSPSRTDGLGVTVGQLSCLPHFLQKKLLFGLPRLESKPLTCTYVFPNFDF